MPEKSSSTDDIEFGDIVALRLHESPEMQVMRTWKDDLANDEPWCHCVWFSTERRLCEADFRCAALRKIEN